MPHSADIERQVGLGHLQRGTDIVGHHHGHHGANFEILPGLAAPGPGKALLDGGAISLQRAGYEIERDPAIGDLRREPHVGLGARAEPDGDIGIHVQDRCQRLADPHGAFSGEGQGNLAAFVGHRRLPAENLSHDGHVITNAPIGLAPGLAVPAFDDLRARNPDAANGAPRRQGVEGAHLHGRHGGGAPGELDDRRAQANPLGMSGQPGQGGYGIRAIGLGGEDSIVAEALGLFHRLERNLQLRA